MTFEGSFQRKLFYDSNNIGKIVKHNFWPDKMVKMARQVMPPDALQPLYEQR